jgi:transporter family protein
MWILLALASAFFAGLTSILAKCGIKKTDSHVATAIRTMVVWVFSWLMVFLVGSQHTVAEIDGKSLLFLILSGLATGASWLCYYKALQDGPASVVVPIDKLSILVTVGFSRLVFKERLSRRAAVGLVLLVAGTLLMIIR